MGPTRVRRLLRRFGAVTSPAHQGSLPTSPSPPCLACAPLSRHSSVTASIVSHGHGRMVADLAADLLQCPEVSRIVITHNIPEDEAYAAVARIEVRRNRITRGYGANQNAALLDATTPFVCVLNPDIRLTGNPFPALLDVLRDEQVGVCAPVTVTANGAIEDSARRFPTLTGLLGKALGIADGTYAGAQERENPDWLAGMFMLFRSSAFRLVGGFDENFFLYYEDVDVCRRLRSAGFKIVQDRSVSAMHAARRQSRHNWRFACWHLASMWRYLVKNRAL